MHRRTLIAIVSAVLLLAVTVAAYKRLVSPLGLLTRGLSRITNGSSGKPTTDRPAPEFAKGTWLNSDPLTLKALRGRVVVVDFWTFACYNCRNMLPYVKGWDERYRDKGLTIVGVHSPELEEERQIENVRRETASLGIRYPVVTDNDYKTWRAYNVNGWPTVYILDKQGRIRWSHVGEGDYDEAESVIKSLLAEELKNP
jgi:thiol-disulfide isomerase/thioredoxin